MNSRKNQLKCHAKLFVNFVKETKLLFMAYVMVLTLLIIQDITMKNSLLYIFPKVQKENKKKERKTLEITFEYL